MCYRNKGQIDFLPMWINSLFTQLQFQFQIQNFLHIYHKMVSSPIKKGFLISRRSYYTVERSLVFASNKRAKKFFTDPHELHWLPQLSARHTYL